jgi:hypothetical protein
MSICSPNIPTVYSYNIKAKILYQKYLSIFLKRTYTVKHRLFCVFILYYLAARLADNKNGLTVQSLPRVYIIYIAANALTRPRHEKIMQFPPVKTHTTPNNEIPCWEKNLYMERENFTAVNL